MSSVVSLARRRTIVTYKYSIRFKYVTPIPVNFYKLHKESQYANSTLSLQAFALLTRIMPSVASIVFEFDYEKGACNRKHDRRECEDGRLINNNWQCTCSEICRLRSRSNAIVSCHNKKCTRWDAVSMYRSCNYFVRISLSYKRKVIVYDALCRRCSAFLMATLS